MFITFISMLMQAPFYLFICTFHNIIAMHNYVNKLSTNKIQGCVAI